MPIVVDNPWASVGEGLREGAGSLAKGMGEYYKTEREKDEKKQKSTLLAGVLENADLSSQEGKIATFNQMISAGVPVKDAAAAIKQLTPGSLEGFLEKHSSPQPPSTMTTPLSTGNPQETETMPTPAYDHPATEDDKFAHISDDALVEAAASKDPELSNFGKSLLDQRDRKHKRFSEDRNYAEKRTRKYAERIDEQRPRVRSKRVALESIKNAFKNRDLSQFSPDWWAKWLGFWGKGLVSPEGAILGTSTKEFVLGDLGRIGGRPNQYIEQRLFSMVPDIGNTEEASLAMAYGIEAQTALEEKEIEFFDKFSEHYENTIGYVPANISRLVDQALQPYSLELQDKLAYQMRELQERTDGIESLAKKKPIKGTPLTAEMAMYFKRKHGDGARAHAKKLGYTIPTIEQWERYNSK